MKKVLLFSVFCLVVSMTFTGCPGQRDGDAIDLGVIFPLSGPQAHFGVESSDGIILAAERINAAGGILGRQINLIIADDENIPANTVANFLRLTTQDGVGIVMGSSTSGATLAIAPMAQQQGVVVISPSATAFGVTQAGDFIFRTCFIDSFQGIVGANFAFDDLGARRAAVLYDQGADYNRGLAHAFIAQFNARGGEIASHQVYMTGAVDFSAQVTSIAAANPDVVFLPNFLNDVALQAMQIRAQGITAPLLGGDGWDGVVGIAGPEIAGSMWSGSFSSETTDPMGAEFVRNFQARFGRTATQFAALGYDTMLLIASAITRAGTTDPSAVRDALAATNEPFVTGVITFDENRNPIKGAVINEIQLRDGVLVNTYRTTVNP
ncbi:MAG: ABC transporter substrate-binding protein [Treponema sp.]|jgi:branched-chain amino acid transport system substrate-binding protein|nr:ABC transporter substrate-binding protein [Treponema sp.]